MGKNHRHKKNLKSEKAKVKLKDRITKTKFLPKGQNITNVEFKVRPIVLPDQLQEKDTSLPLSKRKLNVKDLLSRLKHYNDNVKLGACEELDVMLKIHTEELLGSHLSELLKTVCNLIQDRESKVRKAAAKVIDTILRHSTLENVQPYFQYVMVNLKCAMTHINRNVQEDSLLLLDAILRHIPSILVTEASNILPEFFSLISRLKSESGMSRALTVDLGRKLASVKWHVKVLCRLFALLKAIIGDFNDELSSKNITPVIHTSTSSHMSVYKNCWVNDDPINIFNMVKGSDNATTEDEHKTTLNKYFFTLIPVLHEIWIEALPENTRKTLTDNTSLNEETSVVLSSILRILHMFWKYAEVNKTAGDSQNLLQVFSTKDANQFMVGIMRLFPYRQQKFQKGKKSSKEISKLLEMYDDPNCVRENLLICYIYLKMSFNNNKTSKTYISTVGDYIKTCLVTRNFVNNANVSLFNSLLKLILIDHPKQCINKDLDVGDILEKVIHYYQNTKLASGERIGIFSILISVANNPVLSQLPHYYSWLASLPEELLKPQISQIFVKALLDVSKRNIKLFNLSLLEKLKSILGNLMKIKLLDVDNQVDEVSCKGDIAYIFFYIPELGENHIQAILQFIRAVEDPLWKHSFAFVLRERLMCGKPAIIEPMLMEELTLACI